MYKFFKQPEVPTSSPDVMTFPFEYGPFQYTMENYVRSYTRKRVTKENLVEVMEEVNAAIKTQGDGFKTWDYLSMFFLLALNGGVLACILTLKLELIFLLAIKIGVVFVGIILNFVIYLCCLNGSAVRLRDKVQEILDSKDEYFESKGMRWTVCSENDFPYWIELHIQSQFEMKLKQEREELQGKKKDTQKTNYSENKGILEGGKKAVSKKPNKKGFVNLEEEFNEEDEDGEYENQAQVEAEEVEVDIEDELDQVEDEEHDEPHPHPHSQPHQQEVQIQIKNNKNGKPGKPDKNDENDKNGKNGKNGKGGKGGKSGKSGKKVDRLYAPLEEDYEENYGQDEEAAA